MPWDGAVMLKSAAKQALRLVIDAPHLLDRLSRGRRQAVLRNPDSPIDADSGRGHVHVVGPCLGSRIYNQRSSMCVEPQNKFDGQ